MSSDGADFVDRHMAILIQRVHTSTIWFKDILLQRDLEDIFSQVLHYLLPPIYCLGLEDNQLNVHQMRNQLERSHTTPINELGKGADGIVFRGFFRCDDANKRPAAVKRIEIAKQSYADQEVVLLVKLDSNPHVVCYFCTEKDKQFLYIAIELCDASLDKCFTKENPFDLRGLKPVTLLEQTMIGLKHLHSHNIVHRDVKPHNILLKKDSASFMVKISDFGMSKQLADGRQSYSMRSGALGTIGWNAPEVLDESRKGNPTSAVDIFSAGCVFLLCVDRRQKSPLGHPKRRAGNIEDGKYKLDGLQKDKHGKKLVYN
ncbi:hypothetical protein J4Q44_G00387200 [Coregonus suidteri]|uniref:Protein kinase domain-containing protein n=1 Tax=Coregonus suidteri TaxID=861788 RepID=A0AAN8KKX1_9TELE